MPEQNDSCPNCGAPIIYRERPLFASDNSDSYIGDLYFCDNCDTRILRSGETGECSVYKEE